MGMLYESGFPQCDLSHSHTELFPPPDIVEAKKFYLLAAEKDNPSAFYKLGSISFKEGKIRESINYLKVANIDNILPVLYLFILVIDRTPDMFDRQFHLSNTSRP